MTTAAANTQSEFEGMLGDGLEEKYLPEDADGDIEDGSGGNTVEGGIGNGNVDTAVILRGTLGVGAGLAASKSIESGASDWASADISITLDLEYESIGEEDSPARKSFNEDIQLDLASASGYPAANFHIKQISRGSIIVDIVIKPVNNASLADQMRTPHSVAADLHRQSMIEDSAYKSGFLTRHAKSFSYLPRAPGNGIGNGFHGAGHKRSVSNSSLKKKLITGNGNSSQVCADLVFVDIDDTERDHGSSECSSTLLWETTTVQEMSRSIYGSALRDDDGSIGITFERNQDGPWLISALKPGGNKMRLEKERQRQRQTQN
jgi:hypothetical protein